MEDTSETERFWKKWQVRKSSWDPQPKYSVGPEKSEISASLLKEFETTINKASDENPIQEFLEKNPMFLIFPLMGGHGRWCIPKQSLAGKYVTDFVIGEKSSIGFEWYGVELESPKAKHFSSNGKPTRELSNALNQIRQWRKFVEDNIDFVRKYKQYSGLGLPDIRPNFPCYVIIGREDSA
ncbi:DUF4263 domain-containing protein, partial [Candidatus Woesearchaeota archaeon]|nr:DUF4263 domain-containing protein [Candidatus Woesearchaeota archaeon]